MCLRSSTWLADAKRDVSTSLQTPTDAISSQTHQMVDTNHNDDASPSDKWTPVAISTGDMLSTPTASPAVSELVDKGVTYLRDRIFNRDSGW